MTEITMESFYQKLIPVLERLETTQNSSITQAAQLCAEAIIKGGVIHVFGSGHSVGVGMELTNRPGSLAAFHHIRTDDFVVKGFTTLEDFKDPDDIFERRSSIAERMYEMYHVQQADVFFIISNSGINGLVIDMALKAKAEGQKVIVMTSMEHTLAEHSRHPSGKKLYELADVVIDNCGPYGDALLVTDGPEKVCSISSITGAFVAQSLLTEISRLLTEQKQELPVYWTHDTDGYQEHNAKLKERYARCQ